MGGLTKKSSGEIPENQTKWEVASTPGLCESQWVYFKGNLNRTETNVLEKNVLGEITYTETKAVK